MQQVRNVRDGIFQATLTETYRNADDLLGQILAVDMKLLCRRGATGAANMLLSIVFFFNSEWAACSVY